jgi:hypothetical protein
MFGCDRSIMKGTLLEEHTTFSAGSHLLFKGSFWNSTPTMHAVQLVELWMRSINNKGHFTWRTKYLLWIIYLLFERAFWKPIPTTLFASPTTARSLVAIGQYRKALYLKNRTSSTEYCLLFKGSFWNPKPTTQCICPTIGISLVAIGL